MAWSEWEQAKANATEEEPVRTRLNGTPDGSYHPGRLSTGGGKGDLSVNAKDLAAIGDEAFTLYQRLSRDGDHPKKSTGKAAADLKGDFKLGGALSDVIEKWGKQVDSVRDACAHISNHLDYTKKAHAGDEYHISSKLSLISLQTGFDERSQR